MGRRRRKQKVPLQTGRYQPVPHIWFSQPRELPPFNHSTVRAMLIDPGIRLNLATRAAPLQSAEFGFKTSNGEWQEGLRCDDPVVGNFIYRQLQTIWTKYLPAILRAQTWGWSAGEVTLGLTHDNLIGIQRMEARHASDIKMLKKGPEPIGVEFSRIAGKGKVCLKFPYCWFHNFNAEDGEEYGTPILLGAYSPWADKWFNGGALDVRRLFMHKDAYGGVDLGYPSGTTWDPDTGAQVPNVDIAQQIAEQLVTGGVTTRPSEHDEHGNEKWPLTRAQVTANPQHILQYPKDLDDEIRIGMEIADDVISSDGGGAWAGKRIPLAAFYSTLDTWIVQILTDLCEQIIEPLCYMNFHRIPDYEILHKPLAEQAMEQQSNAGPGQQEGMIDGDGDGMLGEGMPGMEEGMPQPQQPGPGLPAPQAMSLEERIAAEKSPGDVTFAVKAARMALDKAEDKEESPVDAADDYQFAMNDERIAALADVLAAVFGEEAPGKLEQILGPAKMSVWNPDDHPRGPDGRFIKKGTPEAFSQAKGAVDRAHASQSPESMQELMTHMNTLTIKQLHQLKKDFGTKASAATKAKLIEKLSSRLISGRHRLARRDNDTPVAPVNEEVYSVPTEQLHVDPERFQYKVKGIGEKGVGKELKGTGKWNPELGGVLLVWRDPKNNKDYVVNGHHRHELASRTGTDQVNVRYIDAPDSKQARAKGALANIAEGRGTALDAAKYLRDSDRGIDHLQDAGISMSGKVASDAATLTELSPNAFQSVTNGLIEEPTAIAVAKHLDDHTLQDKLFKRIQDREEDGKEWSQRETEQAAKKMAKAGKITKSGTDLFGDFEEEESTFDQEVEIEAYINRQLAQEASDYNAVSNVRRAERVADAGNTLATDENARRRDTARENLETFERESGLKGEVSTAIREYAAQLAEAKNRKQRNSVKSQALEAIREIIDTSEPDVGDVLDESADSGNWKQEEQLFEGIAMSLMKMYGDKPGDHHLEDDEAENVEAGMRKLLSLTNNKPTEDDSEVDAYDDLEWDDGEEIDDEPDEDAVTAEERTLLSLLRRIRMGAAHAPAGGVTIGGKSYKGGEFIPGHTQAEVNKAAGKEGDDFALKPSKERKARKQAPPTKGKQNALFDTKGDPDQMMMFDDGVTPDDRVGKVEGKQAPKDVPGTDIENEETTAPPPGKANFVDVEKASESGVAETSRVGVPGKVVPPPPKIPKLPNLTKHERAVETSFIEAFQADPTGMANDYRKLIAGTNKPYTFETDQAKMLSPHWKDEDQEKQAKKRALNNNALHQTANAIVKRAFLQHLDTLQPGDNVLVTVGGCGAGKGYTLKNTELGKGLSAQAKAVWDSAGDQNATENPWIQEEAEKRGLNVTYAYVSRDPKVAWSNPKLGVVSRAHNPEDGRMVDAAVFADSYVMGARNHHAFHEKNKNNPNAKFLFFDGNTQEMINGVPEESRNMDRKSLYHWALGSIQSRNDVNPHVMRGGTNGSRIWNEEFFGSS